MKLPVKAILAYAMLVFFDTLFLPEVSGMALGTSWITSMPSTSTTPVPSLPTTEPQSQPEPDKPEIRPITITSSGNFSYSLDQLQLEKLPLESMGDNVSGPIEIHINIFDLHMNQKLPQFDPAYFFDNEEGDDSEDVSSEEEPGVSLLKILDVKTNNMLSYDHDDNSIPIQATGQEGLTSQPPIVQLNGMDSASKTDFSSEPGMENKKKLSVDNLDEISEMYSGMALCTRIIKYTAISAAGSTSPSNKSGISVNTLNFFSKLLNCLSTNKAFDEDAKEPITKVGPTPAPEASPQLGQKQIHPPTPPTHSYKVRTARLDHPHPLSAPQTQQLSFTDSAAPSVNVEAEAGAAVSEEANDSSEGELVQGLETDSAPNADYGMCSADDDDLGQIVAIVTVMFFLSTFFAGMLYDNWLWRKVSQFQDMNAKRSDGGKPIWLVFEDAGKAKDQTFSPVRIV